MRKLYELEYCASRIGDTFSAPKYTGLLPMKPFSLVLKIMFLVLILYKAGLIDVENNTSDPHVFLDAVTVNVKLFLWKIKFLVSLFHQSSQFVNKYDAEALHNCIYVAQGCLTTKSSILDWEKLFLESRRAR